MTESPLLLRRDGDVMLLLLNRPPGNVTDFLFFSAFERALEQLSRESGLKGLVVTTTGNHFSSGADLDELQKEIFEKSSGEKEISHHSTRIFQQLADLDYPVVAAVRGACLGSGLELALCCDYRIGTRTSIYSLPEAGFGLMPGCGGTLRLVQLIGRSAALLLILGADRLLGEEALKLGLIDRLVPKNELVHRAKELVFCHTKVN
ncbi:MAG: enoyl-CoA hydratase/isomerase family protein [Thermodesulfobacteriota bacterium]